MWDDSGWRPEGCWDLGDTTRFTLHYWRDGGMDCTEGGHDYLGLPLCFAI